jgi:hypothetical protein
MASVSAGTGTTARQVGGAQRFGYIVAVSVNAALLWVAHGLLDWGWPAFLTDDFNEVLGLLSASLIAGMVSNAAFIIHDRGRFRAAADLVTTALGLAVTVRIWTVFPFDFSVHGQDWTWMVRALLVIAIVGTAIAIVTNLGKVIRPTDEGSGRP